MHLSSTETAVNGNMYIDAQKLKCISVSHVKISQKPDLYIDRQRKHVYRCAKTLSHTYTCIHVHICIYAEPNIYMYTFIVHGNSAKHKCVYIRTNSLSHMFTCTCIHVHICIYVEPNIYMYTFIIHGNSPKHKCTYIHTLSLSHIYTYIYTHTQFRTSIKRALYYIPGLF